MKVALVGLVCVLSGIALSAPESWVAVGLDLGAASLKIAALKGNRTFDIVLNEQSRRKTPAVLAFRNGQRYVGDEAAQLAPRFPWLVAQHFVGLLGAHRESAAVSGFRQDGYLADVVHNRRGGVSFQLGPKRLSAEEGIASVLHYAAVAVEADTASRMGPVVVTTPGHLSLRQRTSLATAAAVANVSLVGTVRSTAALALQFGTSRRGFGNDTVHLLVLDVGASWAEAAVFRFSPSPRMPNSTRPATEEALGTITAVATASAAVGGRSLDVCIAKLLEDRAAAENPAALRVLGNASTEAERKVAYSYLRAAQQAKEKLSTIAGVEVKIEGAVPSRDEALPIRVTATEVGERCGHIITTMAGLAADAIDRADVGLDFIELGGAGSRIRGLPAAVQERIGRAPERTLNSDDSAALGAVTVCIRASGVLRMRGFRLVDPLPIESDIAASSEATAAKPRPMLQRPEAGTRHSVSLLRYGDFNLTIASRATDADTRAGSIGTVTLLSVSGVPEAHKSLMEEAAARNGTHTEQGVRVAFDVDHRGTITNATAECKVSYNLTKTKATRVAKGKPAVERIVTKRFFNLTELVVNVSHIGEPRPFTSEEVEVLKARFEASVAAAATIADTATARNDMTTLLQHLRAEALSQLPVREQSAARVLLEEAEQWVEGPGAADTVTAANIRERAEALRDAFLPAPPVTASTDEL